jgi:hypothetical protein
MEVLVLADMSAAESLHEKAIHFILDHLHILGKSIWI